MRIRARIASTQAISTSLSDINRIRLSSPAIAIKPSILLEELIDVTTVGVENENILIFSATTRQFVPSEKSSLFSVKNVFGGQF
jgi:hypothetical protein